MGNPSVDVKWEQNQSQGLQKQNTKAEAPSCPNWREKKPSITFNGSRIGPKRTGLILISFSFLGLFSPPPVSNIPPTPSLLPPPLFDLICNDLLHFLGQQLNGPHLEKKKYIYIKKKKWTVGLHLWHISKYQSSWRLQTYSLFDCLDCNISSRKVSHLLTSKDMRLKTNKHIK